MARSHYVLMERSDEKTDAISDNSKQMKSCSNHQRPPPDLFLYLPVRLLQHFLSCQENRILKVYKCVYLVCVDGVGPHPAHPAEAGDDAEQVAGDKVPNEAAQGNQPEELEAAHALRGLLLVQRSGRRGETSENRTE